MGKAKGARESERGDGHKRRLLRLMGILRDETDKNHRATTGALLDRLGLARTAANKRNLRRDVRVMREEGVRVEAERHRECEYYLGERLFGPGELQALVDIVQSSRSIDQETSERLISSILSLVSEADARPIRRRIRLGRRAKTSNREVFDAIDVIHGAMEGTRHEVSFRYFDVGPRGRRVYRYDGGRVCETPVVLTHMSDCYYLITYDRAKDRITTRRLDRMEGVEDTGRRGARSPLIEAFDLADFERTQFGMFVGPATRVTMLAGPRGLSALYDRFGDAVIERGFTEDGAARVAVDVTLSPQFYGWARGLDGMVSVVAPAEVREECYRRVDGSGWR